MHPKYLARAIHMAPLFRRGGQHLENQEGFSSLLGASPRSELFEKSHAKPKEGGGWRDKLQHGGEQNLAEKKEESRDHKFLPIKNFFSKKGTLAVHTPHNWSLAACLGKPLSQSQPTQEKHGSLSTRQQLMNTQRTLERSKKLVDDQIKNTLSEHDQAMGDKLDPQSMRQLRLLFAPLKVPPSDPTFKKHLAVQYIEEMPEEEDDSDGPSPTANETSNARKPGGAMRKKGLRMKPGRSGTEVSTKKMHGAGMSNEQRALLLMVFKRYIIRVSNKENRSALMQRSTWFRTLVHMRLLGPSDSWDHTEPTEMRITFLSAAKIFRLFMEPSAPTPVLTFSGFANALQAVVRSQGVFDTAADANKTLFDTFLPRAQEILGITTEDARRAAVKDQRRSVIGQRKSMSESRRSIAAGAGAPSPAGSSARSLSRSMSFFSEGGSSVFGDDNQSEADDTGPFAKMIPLTYQVQLAEEQMCEPECIEMLHQYQKPLKRLFHHYAGADSGNNRISPGGDSHKISDASLRNMLQELHLFPAFVQSFSLSRHINISQVRRSIVDGEDDLEYDAFVEVLCRIGFVYLNTYGNSFQQSASSKCKLLWLFAVISANLPQKLGSRVPSQIDEDVRGPDSLWNAKTRFNLSECPLEDLVMYAAMHDGVSVPARARTTTMDMPDLDRMISERSDQ